MEPPALGGLPRRRRSHRRLGRRRRQSEREGRFGKDPSPIGQSDPSSEGARCPAHPHAHHTQPRVSTHRRRKRRLRYCHRVAPRRHRPQREGPKRMGLPALGSLPRPHRSYRRPARRRRRPEHEEQRGTDCHRLGPRRRPPTAKRSSPYCAGKPGDDTQRRFTQRSAAATSTLVGNDIPELQSGRARQNGTRDTAGWNRMRTSVCRHVGRVEEYETGGGRGRGRDRAIDELPRLFNDGFGRRRGPGYSLWTCTWHLRALLKTLQSSFESLCDMQ